ncbi:MAG: fibronectin type III domain-containing protein [Candidatus Kerfeldbacteria bacterium]|nr:fibronectin type III domain-containing protein [Candidatus Kerfeldbacteria bacterium]
MHYKPSSIVAVSVLAVMTAWSIQPVAAKSDCAGITIEGDPSDWANVSALLTDDQDVTGLTYYYDGTNWSTTDSAAALYSADVVSMQDLETVKVCNSATQLQLYIDTYHPLVAYQDIASGTYYEFGDTNGPDSEVGLPATLDFWLVFALQQEQSDDIYYYAIYFYAEAGDLGLEQGPTQTAIYQETDASTDITAASFNPNDDDLLVEIDSETSDDASKETKTITGDGKIIDASGGLESDVALMNSDGNGLFSLSDIRYGDDITIAVTTYDGSSFSEAKEVAGLAGADNSDQTTDTQYRIKKVGPTGVKVHKAKVTWEAVTDANNYTLQLTNRHGKVLETFKTKKKYYTLTGLTADQVYYVQVRAKVGEFNTGWSEAIKVKIK